MKTKKFEIKIWDLLKSPWKQDTLEFDELFPEIFTNLTKKGISGKLTLQAINNEELFAKIEDVYCEFNDICDRCVENFIRKVECSEFEAKFMVPRNEEQTEDELDEFFPIDPKSEIINIKDIIIQSVLIQEPISKKCPKCINIITDDEEDLDEYSSSFSGWNSNITFS